MLVSARGIEQTIVIGGNVTVAVLGVQGDRVKLGFIAPDDVVLREELGPEDKSLTPWHKGTGGMLILTRKVKGEGVFIGEDIFVKVLGADKRKVRLGTTAPDNVYIDRGILPDMYRSHGSRERL